MTRGFAVRFHGHYRSTDDLDVWIEDTVENRENLRQAIIQITNDDFNVLSG